MRGDLKHAESYRAMRQSAVHQLWMIGSISVVQGVAFLVIGEEIRPYAL